MELLEGEMVVITAKEAMERLACGKTTLYKLFNQGELRGYRVGANGGGIRITSESVDTYMERRMNTPAAEASPAVVEVTTKKVSRKAKGKGSGEVPSFEAWLHMERQGKPGKNP